MFIVILVDLIGSFPRTAVDFTNDWGGGSGCWGAVQVVVGLSNPLMTQWRLNCYIRYSQPIEWYFWSQLIHLLNHPTFGVRCSPLCGQACWSTIEFESFSAKNARPSARTRLARGTAYNNNTVGPLVHPMEGKHTQTWTEHVQIDVYV